MKRREYVSSPLSDYANKMISERLTRMLAHLDGVRQGKDIEPVHQMRVWSRRSRAALDVFRNCYPSKAFARLEREVKSVTRALGAARDLDVMISTLKAREEALPPEQRGGLDSFVAHLQEQRQSRQKEVHKALDQLEKFDILTRFASLRAQPVQAKSRQRISTRKQGCATGSSPFASLIGLKGEEASAWQSR